MLAERPQAHQHPGMGERAPRGADHGVEAGAGSLLHDLFGGHDIAEPAERRVPGGGMDDVGIAALGREPGRITLSREAICEAVTRPYMRYVPIKTIAQHDLRAMHRVREQIIKSRTALANQIRGLLSEYGIVIPQGIEKVRKAVPLIVEDAENVLADMVRSLFGGLYEALVGLDERLLQTTRHIEQICRTNEVCQRLVKADGIGPITATALVAALGDARHFKNGRQLAAWIGLVLRQGSSGGKHKLLGISKRGNSYLRKQLVHGARSVVYRSRTREDIRSQWLRSLEIRRGMNRATVAQANKAARIAWVLMAKEESYRPTS